MRDFITLTSDTGTRIINPALVTRGEVDGKTGNAILHQIDGGQVSLTKKEWEVCADMFINSPPAAQPAGQQAAT